MGEAEGWKKERKGDQGEAGRREEEWREGG